MLGKIEVRGNRGQQRIRWLDGITDSMDMHLSKLKLMMDREAWHVAGQRVSQRGEGLKAESLGPAQIDGGNSGFQTLSHFRTDSPRHLHHTHTTQKPNQGKLSG